MQPVTFTCVHCNNLMAVGPELVGQQVRCPTCGQVVQAPMPMQQPAFVLEPAPLQPPGVVANEENPFSISTPAETPESIFGEGHDEDIFGTAAPKVEIPTDVPVPSPNGSSHTGFAPYPPPETLTVGAPPASEPIAVETIVPPSPFELQPVISAQGPATDLGATLPHEMPTQTPTEPAHEVPWPAAQMPTSAFENQSAGETPVVYSDSPAGGAFVEGAVAPADVQQRQAPERKRHSFTAVTFLAPYALISTAIAVYFGYQYYDLRSQHPLERIPDIIGEYDPAKRNPNKQTSERKVTLPPTDQKLPEKLKVQLGETLRIGDLEVRPLRIEENQFQFTIVYESGAVETRKSPHAALILHARLKNVSQDVVFHPTDPFFDRQYIADQHRSKPFTFLEVGEQKFYGGPFNYLGFRRDSRKRVFATGQENDDKPLQPGEERETRFYTFPDRDGGLLAAVHAFPDTMTWRLQLRRGLMNFKNHEYSMCAVVGVQFRAADVHKVN